MQISATPPGDKLPPPPRLASHESGPGVAPDALTLSPGAKLVEGNQRAVSQAWASARALGGDPRETLKAIALGTWRLMSNPLAVVSDALKNGRRDPLGTAIDIGGLVGTYAGIAALPLAAAAYLAAPATGGASMALLPIATQIGSVAGAICLTTLGLSFAKNQVDLANAKTMAELEAQSAELAGDVLDAGITFGINGGAQALKGGLTRMPQFEVPAAPIPVTVDGNTASTLLGVAEHERPEENAPAVPQGKRKAAPRGGVNERS